MANEIPGVIGAHMREQGLVAASGNSSPPWQNGRHFEDDIFRCIFVNEELHILIKISLNFVPKGPVHNNSALA